MRVAGQRLHDLLKMDARGMPISTFFDPDAHTDIAQLIEDAFSTPSIVTIPLVSAGNLLRHEVTGTMLLLPLRDGKGETTRILGALVAEGNVGHRPRRFQIRKDAPLRNEPLIPRLASTQSIPRPGNAKRPNPSGPALRIVVNNG